MDSKPLVAEFIGTFALVFIGAGAGAVSGNIVAVALAHGLVIVAFAYAYGHISGTHINPAVTIGLWVSREIETTKAVAYIIVQLLGGIVAGFLLGFLLSGQGTSLGATVLAAGVTPVQGLIIELILTFFLVNSVLNAGVSNRAGIMAPVAIGLTLAFSIMMGGNLTGASLNPARTLGPGLASGNMADIWLYFVGPIAGGILAGLLYTYFLKSSE